MKIVNESADMPKISVIVPFYNVERYARQCIESIQNQTYRNLEIILVDDGSPDNCGKICDEYATSDKRIKVIHKPNGGLSSARNAGLDAATGEYIGFVDSDDWIEPEMYERMLASIITTHADISVCNITYDYQNVIESNKYKVTTDKVVFRDEVLRMLMDDKYLNSYAVNKLYKRSVITYQFPLSHDFEDIYVAIRWFSNATSISFIAFEGYHYRQRKGSIMHNDCSRKHVHYLESCIAQYEYLKKTGFLNNEISQYGLTLVVRCIREVKLMARNLPANEDYYIGLNKVHDLLEPYISEAWPKLKQKYREHYTLFTEWPRLFHWYMKLGQVFHKTKKIAKSNHEFFD